MYSHLRPSRTLRSSCPFCHVSLPFADSTTMSITQHGRQLMATIQNSTGRFPMARWVAQDPEKRSGGNCRSPNPDSTFFSLFIPFCPPVSRMARRLKGSTRKKKQSHSTNWRDRQIAIRPFVCFILLLRHKSDTPFTLTQADMACTKRHCHPHQFICLDCVGYLPNVRSCPFLAQSENAKNRTRSKEEERNNKKSSSRQVQPRVGNTKPRIAQIGATGDVHHLVSDFFSFPKVLKKKDFEN